MLLYGMVSMSLFAVGLGLAMVFAFLSVRNELHALLTRRPVRVAAHGAVHTSPGLPFFMSERFLCVTALSLSVFVVSLVP
jgi:hypothetical protein